MWLGYPGSSGATYMEYIITGEWDIQSQLFNNSFVAWCNAMHVERRLLHHFKVS